MDVVVWSKLAERCATLGKGCPVLIEGRLETKSFTDSNNQNRKSVEIVADSVQSLKATYRSENESEAPKTDASSKPPQITDDDVPF